MSTLGRATGLAALIVFLAVTLWVAVFFANRPVAKIDQDLSESLSKPPLLLESSPSEQSTSTVVVVPVPEVQGLEQTDSLQLETKLEKTTKTVEIYLLPPTDQRSTDCTNVVARKRTVKSSGVDTVSHYRSALDELVKGLTIAEKKAGYESALPLGVDVLEVRQDESGRLVGNFSSELIAGVTDTCQRNAIYAQIKNTLKTIPQTGNSLTGKIEVEGRAAEY